MRLQMEKNNGRCERQKRDHTHTYTQKKDTKRESLVVSLNNFKRLRTSAGRLASRKKKKRKRERERRGRTISSYERDGKSFLEL
jgi:hypothetical protein